MADLLSATATTPEQLTTTAEQLTATAEQLTATAEQQTCLLYPQPYAPDKQGPADDGKRLGLSESALDVAFVAEG